MGRFRATCGACFGLAALTLAGAISAAEPQPPQAENVGELETIAVFEGAMPTGVAVSQTGRIFVNFPRWGDDVPFTVAELRDGKINAYPDAAINRLDAANPAKCFVSVQSVVFDPKNRLWVLDTGSVEFGPTSPGGPKLIGYDLETDQAFKTITFPPDVALKTTYLNDVRFDLRKGKAGVAYITDSSVQGPNGLIVVDLDSGASWRRLHDHPSTKATPDFLPIVEGRALLNRPADGPPRPMTIGSDGIALSPDGEHLYYCPLSSRRLYRVKTAALLKREPNDEEASRAVEDLGDRGFASDGLEMDAAGRLYLTNYEDNAIMRRTESGDYETIAYDARLLWPDTLSLATDGRLYVTANQLHRQKQFHGGRDLRKKPYAILRLDVGAQPVLLK